MPLDFSYSWSYYTHCFRLGKIKKKEKWLSEYFFIQKCYFFATNMYCKIIENTWRKPTQEERLQLSNVLIDQDGSKSWAIVLEFKKGILTFGCLGKGWGKNKGLSWSERIVCFLPKSPKDLFFIPAEMKVKQTIHKFSTFLIKLVLPQTNS